MRDGAPQQPTPPAIELRDVGVRYRRYMRQATTLKEAVTSLFKGTHYESFWALRTLSLTVQRGERLGVVGPNGAGKTTLLKAMAGVLPPSEGSVTVRGRIVPLLELGAGFRADLTGRENVFLNGAIMGLDKRAMEERYDRIVEFAGIGDFIDAPLCTYSSGMRARLGFAVASDVDPEILLLDELFAAGDAAFRKRAFARMDAFFDAGKTVVLVSHSLDHISRLCDRAICIRGGQVTDDGPPQEVVSNYLADVESRAGNQKKTG